MSLYLIVLVQGLSMNLELGWSKQSQGILLLSATVFGSLVCMVILGFYMSARDLNSGPYGCTESSLTSPQPLWDVLSALFSYLSFVIKFPSASILSFTYEFLFLNIQILSLFIWQNIFYINVLLFLSLSVFLPMYKTFLRTETFYPGPGLKLAEGWVLL